MGYLFYVSGVCFIYSITVLFLICFIIDGSVLDILVAAFRKDTERVSSYLNLLALEV